MPSEAAGYAWPGQRALSDLGLLKPLLVERAAQPRFDLGIVPHWTDWTSPVDQRGLFASPGVRLIDPLRPMANRIESAVAIAIRFALDEHLVSRTGEFITLLNESDVSVRNRGSVTSPNLRKPEFLPSPEQDSNYAP